MTRAQTRAHWSRTPSATQLWLGTMLRAFAMLVLAVAAIVQMRPSRRAHECDMTPMPEALPRRARDAIREKVEAAANSRTTAQHRVCVSWRLRPRRLVNWNRNGSGAIEALFEGRRSAGLPAATPIFKRTNTGFRFKLTSRA